MTRYESSACGGCGARLHGLLLLLVALILFPETNGLMPRSI